MYALRRRLRNRRNGSERGSVLIELTLVTPLFIMMVMGMLELGVAWRDSITVTQASRQGARVGSHLGDASAGTLAATTRPEQELLLSLRTVLTPEEGQIQYVVVYNSDANGGMVAACDPRIQATPTSVNGQCNVYTGAQLTTIIANDSQWNSKGNCTAGLADTAWCPTMRSNSDEYLGVYVQFERPKVTGFFGTGSYELKATTVMRIEPEYS
ncbi:MAG: Flp pilus assembly protein TadG [Acidimicrobiales bacterium]|jgi:Flp pilus assembly protein TadG